MPRGLDEHSAYSAIDASIAEEPLRDENSQDGTTVLRVFNPTCKLSQLNISCARVGGLSLNTGA